MPWALPGPWSTIREPSYPREIVLTISSLPEIPSFPVVMFSRYPRLAPTEADSSPVTVTEAPGGIVSGS